jgi:hypothetical protein
MNTCLRSVALALSSFALSLASASLQAQATPDATPHALCDARANALFDALGAEDYEAATADFDAALRARYPAAKIRQDYAALSAAIGRPLGRGRPHSSEVAEQIVVMVPLIFERGTLTAEVHCNADGGISDFRLEATQAMSRP